MNTFVNNFYFARPEACDRHNIETEYESDM